jgi:hypothetical protein
VNLFFASIVLLQTNTHQVIPMIRMTRFSQFPSRLAVIGPVAALFVACSATPVAPEGSSTGPPAGQPGAESPSNSPDANASTTSPASDAATDTDASSPSTSMPTSDAATDTDASNPSTATPTSDAATSADASKPSTAPSDASTGAGAVAPSLGSASSFAVLGASTVTCTNMSAVTGDVGVSPGTAITGFAPSCTVTGTIHAGDAVATQAHTDLATAYGALKAVSCQHNLTGQDLGGQTLAPGVYCFNTTVGLTGALTLDGAGDSNATWIFQIGTALATGSSSSVVMAGSGKPGNVFWQVGSSATIAMGTAFQGNVLASASVTLVSGSNLVGRALAMNAAVTSDHNAVSLPQ